MQADENALFENLQSQGWRDQSEMVKWMVDERGVIVSRSTISRLIKRRQWSQKNVAQISQTAARNGGKMMVNRRLRSAVSDRERNRYKYYTVITAVDNATMRKTRNWIEIHKETQR